METEDYHFKFRITLLGEKSVSIDPEPLKPGQKLREVNNEILFAVDVSTVEDTFDELKEASNKLDLLLDNATGVLDELKQGKTWENLSITMQNLQEITTALNQKERIDSMYTSLESTLKISNIYKVLNKYFAGSKCIVK